MSTPSKRPAGEFHAPATPETPLKKPRTNAALTTPTAATCQVYQTMVSTYGTELTLDQFTGLCAYLCALLSWGHQMHVGDVDTFILSYPLFHQHLAHCERQRSTTPEIRLPAYHQWFEENRLGLGSNDKAVVDRQKLRSIWQENPYVFLRTQHSLRAIANLAAAARALKQSRRDHRSG